MIKKLSFRRLLFFVFFLIIGRSLCAQSGIFDRTGIIPGHGSYSSVPEESVDLFTGNVTLRYLDYSLPGPNGLDVKIWRVYNSKILKDRQSGNPSIQAERKSWVGIGWTMHMGRVHNYGTTTPIIEFPDGRFETAWPDNYPDVGKNITRDFLRYDRAAYKLYFQDGTVWTFGAWRTITKGDSSTEVVRLVTKIENTYGQSINIDYDANRPSIDKITDACGRVIDFVSTGTDSTTRTLSASANGGSFYIYSITGVLLAEYSRSDDNVPVKDYIYVGGRLLAEYKPQGNRTYFYTPDQINSTRVVTDETGTVVYSAAHDPYGGIQQTWTNTYDPTPKFSGKERDSESGLDYFGARYYDRAQYRFISVDPVIDVHLSINDPIRSNLYAYCGGNPISFIDPDGESYLVFYRDRQELELYDCHGNLVGRFDASNNVEKGHTPMPAGKWGFDHFSSHIDGCPEDPISSSGFYGFKVVIDGCIDVAMGVHAGHFDSYNDWTGQYEWQWMTHGCIRTTEEAMFWICWLAYFMDDPLTDLIVM